MVGGSEEVLDAMCQTRFSQRVARHLYLARRDIGESICQSTS